MRCSREDLAQALEALIRRGCLWEPQSARPLHLKAEWTSALQVPPSLAPTCMAPQPAGQVWPACGARTELPGGLCGSCSLCSPPPDSFP